MMQSLKKAAPLLAFILAYFLLQNWWRVELLLDPISNNELHARDIVMYSTSWCPYCAKARAFFKQADIPYTEYDIEKSAEAKREYEQINGRGIPVIKIGSTVIQGYDPKLIRQAIENLNSSKRD